MDKVFFKKYVQNIIKTNQDTDNQSLKIMAQLMPKEDYKILVQELTETRQLFEKILIQGLIKRDIDIENTNWEIIKK